MKNKFLLASLSAICYIVAFYVIVFYPPIKFYLPFTFIFVGCCIAIYGRFLVKKSSASIMHKIVQGVLLFEIAFPFIFIAIQMLVRYLMQGKGLGF